MKIFLDSVDIKEIEKHRHLIDGVTTNPFLMQKATTIRYILNGLISLFTWLKVRSVGVISSGYDDMISESRKIADIAENIVIKIPMTEEGLRATRVLYDINIKINVTLIFPLIKRYLLQRRGLPTRASLTDVSMISVRQGWMW